MDAGCAQKFSVVSVIILQLFACNRKAREPNFTQCRDENVEIVFRCHINGGDRVSIIVLYHDSMNAIFMG